MRLVYGAGCVIGLMLAGCSTCELVEAELRHQTNRVAELEQELDQSKREIAALKAGWEESRQPPASPPGAVHPSSPAHEMARLTLGATTGGRDRDRDGYDEELQVVLAPIDAEGDARKVSGWARITVFDDRDEASEPLGIWEVPAANLRSTWRSSLFGAGFHLALPWQRPPASAAVRVCASFVAADGTEFTAEKTCRVKPAVAERLVPPKPAAARLPLSAHSSSLADALSELPANPHAEAAALPPAPLPFRGADPTSEPVDWIVLPVPDEPSSHRLP